jgi:OOP family OmpA-OmpF porin
MTRTTMKLWLLPLALLALAAAGGVAQDGAAARKPYTLEGNEVKVEGAVAFADGSDRLLPASEKALDAVKTYLDDKQYITTLRVEGHTGEGADAAASQALSERRALAVARRLVEKGVDCKRLVAVGFGGTKPVAPDDSPENRAKNRRIVFANAALRGRLIGGMPADGGGAPAGDPCSESRQ